MFSEKELKMILEWYETHTGEWEPTSESELLELKIKKMLLEKGKEIG